MPRINLAAVLVSAALAFMIGALWYSPLLFGKAYVALRGPGADGVANAATPAAAIAGEFVRWLVIASVLAGVMARLGVADLAGALVFAGCTWVAIYAALAGSVLHEGYPWRLYALHAGDGGVKIALIAAILSQWRAH